MSFKIIPSLMTGLILLAACLDGAPQQGRKDLKNQEPGFKLAGVYQTHPRNCSTVAAGSYRNACLADRMTITWAGNKFIGEYEFFTVAGRQVLHSNVGEFSFSNFREVGGKWTASLKGRGAGLIDGRVVHKAKINRTVTLNMKGSQIVSFTWAHENASILVVPLGTDTFYNVNAIGQDLGAKNMAFNTYGNSSMATVRQNRQTDAQRRNQQALAFAGAVVSGVAAANGTAARGSNQPTQSTSQRNPSHSGSNLVSSPFVRKDLRNFTVSSDRIQVCVWDDECVDGDRVSVTASAGRQTLTLMGNRQLTNAQYCQTINLNALYHRGDGAMQTGAKLIKPGQKVRITLKALNGSGNIGQCNYANRNTGAISISGGGGKDTWALRGGQGTTGTLTYRP